MIPSPLAGPFYDPLRAQHREALDGDRRVVAQLAATLDAQLLPAVVSDHAPGWQGPARRAFELRREHLGARLRQASAGLEETSAALAVALVSLEEWP